MTVQRKEMIMYRTDRDAMEYITRAIDGCGEKPEHYDVESIASELYLANEAAGVPFLNRWNMALVESERFWTAVMLGRYIGTVA